MDFYVVHETNPNDKIGGGGCVATGAHAGEDCEGPWIEFPRVSTEHDASPYTVICSYHLKAVTKGYRKVEQIAPGDVLPLRDVRTRGTFATA
jgi:hypothetical protein